MSRDAELIEGMTRGDSRAFAELYERYRVRLHQYARSLIRSRMEAEDVVHDVFIGLAKQASQGRVPREASAYLYVSVRNRCVDRMRKRPELPLDEVDFDLFVAPAGDAERIALGRVLHHALLALPVEQREVVVLKTWHDLEFAAIARIQGTPVNTALSRYQYGLSKSERSWAPMDEDGLERLLRSYRLPDVTPDLDHRVLSEGSRILAPPVLEPRGASRVRRSAGSASAISPFSSTSSPQTTPSIASLGSRGGSR